VHVEHLRGACYGLHIQSHLAPDNQSRVPIVWDSVDCISLLFRQAMQQSLTLKGRLMSRLELPRTARYEGRLVHQFDGVLLSSSVDAAAMNELANGQIHCETASRSGLNSASKLAVVPNGVDLDYFQPNLEPRHPERLVFTGKMSYHANATAALYLLRDIMPRVWEQRPKAQVWIVGKEPPAEIRNLATCAQDDYVRLQTIDRPVIITGTVPDIRPYLETATIAVAPVVYGAGIQNKVLEAMACGAPVIASPQAVAALKIQQDTDLIIADNAYTFAQSILHLLDSSPRQNQLSLAGRAYVERYHSWANVAAQLVDIYATTIAQCHPRS
jgi:polysaccharide biosynthesis protein PslH